VVLSTASIFSDFWQNQLVEHDRQALFLVLVGFLGSFLFIRTSARLMRSPRVPWWPGSVVSESGLHIHHLVFGIVTMMAAGSLGFAFYGESPWTEICAAAFGIGVGLTIDEFALWVHLDDVYWAEEGRRSIDAAIVAALIMALIVFGVNPVEVATDSPEAAIGSVLAAALNLAVAMICFFKDRILHGIVGFFIFPVGLYGAWRLGKPGSAWARRRYGERNPEKQRRSEERFPPGRRTQRLKEKFRDVIGGVVDPNH
jgi:hypothetical protein